MRVTVGLWLALSLALVGCDDNVDPPDGGEDPDGGRYCDHDLLDGPSSAADLTVGEGDQLVAEGFVCPVADTDWYRLELPADHHLVQVSLSITGPGSPVQPTYAIYECDSACVADPPEGETDQSCCDARVAPRPEEVSDAVEVTHCLAPGDYYLVVRDLGDDGQDSREPRGLYQVAVTTSPDADASETNDDPSTATTPDASGSRQWTARGQIGCRGDQDWYVLDGEVGDDDLLEVELTAPIAGFQPRYRVLRADSDDTLEVGSQINASGTVEPTDLGETFWLETGGRYYVVVDDDDGGEADPGATYELTLRLVNDPDDNEPNNSPEDATNLGNLSCGDSWASLSSDGTLSATNDVDIYRVALDAGCAGGVLEAEVDFSGTPSPGLEPSVRLVRAHAESPCTGPTDCRQIQLECDAGDPAGFDCAGYGNICHSDGLCAGANLCLPGGVCGAAVLERHPDYCAADGHCRGTTGSMRSRPCEGDDDCAPQDRIATAIPIGRNPSGPPSAVDQIFVVVSDFQSNAADPSLSYDLRVRTRRDPDGNEPNEHYDPALAADGGSAEMATAASWGGCVSGQLSYERDQDWFSLPHPCPGTGGCTLRVTYEVDGGPVEVLAFARGAWDNLTDLDPDVDRESNSASSGTIGGAGDCLPANDNLDDPISVVVRDIDLVRDWSTEQSYRLCFDAPTPGCNAPCEVLGGQCWYPEE